MLMPSDMSVWQRMDRAFWNRARWNLKFAWWPHRCEFSGQLIWFKQAYCGTARWMGPGPDAVEVRWAESTEYLIWALKR
jgi:hypothetical protein